MTSALGTLQLDLRIREKADWECPSRGRSGGPGRRDIPRIARRVAVKIAESSGHSAASEIVIQKHDDQIDRWIRGCQTAA